LVAGAEEAGVAGCGVERDDTVAGLEVADATTGFDHGTGKLVTEGDGWLEHHGVIAAAVDLEVRSTCERGTDAEDELAMACVRNGNLLKTKVFLAIENCGEHLAVDVDGRIGE
jgi:hypothetical protein